MADGKVVAISRPEADIAQAVRWLLPFRQGGYTLFPLRKAGNTPRDSGWRVAPYKDFDCANWLRAGGNIGIRLEGDDLVVDVDPRNDGLFGLACLLFDSGLSTLPPCPHVLSGGGGDHYFFKKQEGDNVHGSMKGYPGVDFKKLGGYVVAVGSVHVSSGRTYRPASSFSPTRTPYAPFKLLEAIRRPAFGERTGAPGVFSPELLGEFLAVVPATVYGDGNYLGWIGFSAGCYDGTNGTGFAQWAAWCKSDPRYADQSDDALLAKWDSFEAGRAGGATYKKVLWAVVQAGRKDLVADLGWGRAIAGEYPDDESWGFPE